MPIARFKSVLLCSSEDKNYPATNLTNNSNKKWKCEDKQEDSAYVVVQLENPIKISGIDIGNENSAFIEVSVGRTGWPFYKFKTILVSSSFMTITESRVSENPNRVRCFGKDALIPDVAKEKWDLVKVTCSQGFNKHVQFGLCFIKIHTQDTVLASISESSPVKQTVGASPKEKKNCDEALGLPKNSAFAKFRMRVNSSDSDDKEPETLFSKWKKEQKKDSPVKDSSTSTHNVTACAAIRDASSSISKLKQCTKINHNIAITAGRIGRADVDEKKPHMKRYRPALLYDDDDENTSNPKLEKIINKDKERIERERKEFFDKKKGKKDVSHEEKTKNKMKTSTSTDQSKDSSSKTLVHDGDDDISMVKTRSPEKVDRPAFDSPQAFKQSSLHKGSDTDDDDICMVKTQSPVKVDLAIPASPQASRPKSPSTPPAWKVKNKRQSTSDENSASKRSRNSPSPERDDILRGIVFVISGIQNPERADMRQKAVNMGAKYKPDWDDSCTHLICAFKNTPKYKQVQGSGIIVNKEWISDCFAQKKKLSWKDYQL